MGRAKLCVICDNVIINSVFIFCQQCDNMFNIKATGWKNVKHLIPEFKKQYLERAKILIDVKSISIYEELEKNQNCIDINSTELHEKHLTRRRFNSLYKRMKNIFSNLLDIGVLFTISDQLEILIDDNDDIWILLKSLYTTGELNPPKSSIKPSNLITHEGSINKVFIRFDKIRDYFNIFGSHYNWINDSVNEILTN